MVGVTSTLEYWQGYALGKRTLEYWQGYALGKRDAPEESQVMEGPWQELCRGEFVLGGGAGGREVS